MSLMRQAVFFHYDVWNKYPVLEAIIRNGLRGSEYDMNCIPVIDTAATGANITRLRKNVNLTVRELQSIFGFATPQAIYKWQRGEAMPTLDNMVMLAYIFGVTVDDIVVFKNQNQLRVIA